jgi:hypothetical protein
MGMVICMVLALFIDRTLAPVAWGMVIVLIFSCAIVGDQLDRGAT